MWLKDRHGGRKNYTKFKNIMWSILRERGKKKERRKEREEGTKKGSINEGMKIEEN
jgi:hypothetical protein